MTRIRCQPCVTPMTPQDTCVDRTVKEILAADPVPFDTFDNKVTAGTGEAQAWGLMW